MRIKKLSSVVKKYLQNVKRAGIPITKVYIFGSQVKGNSRTGSDIDLCLISPRFGRDRQKERLRLMNLRDESTGMIEPHPYSPADFQNPFDFFSSEIKKTAITL